MNLVIRQESKADFDDVYGVNKTAFQQDDEAMLVNRLRKSNAFISDLSLVGIVDNRIVGHILFSRIKIKDDKGNQYESLALAPMAVSPEYQKQGIGSQLIVYGLNKARKLGHKSVIVLGHEHYYTKFGFVPAEKWNIKCPYDVPSSVFMGIELVKDGLKDMAGTVQYSDEFEA